MLNTIATELYGRLLAIALVPILQVIDVVLPRARNKDEIWLVGENQGECLGDNGYAFYSFCRQAHPDAAVYFLVKNRTVRLRQEFASDPNVVRYGSARHMRLFVKSGVQFYTHTYRDLLYRRLFELLGRRKKLVYLHHGTLGFKKFDAFYHKHRNRMSIFTVGSEMERKLLVGQADVDADRVRVTGYARTDLLSAKKPTIRQVLYIPTHRRHLGRLAEEQFGGHIRTLLSDARLLESLERCNMTLKLCFHAHTRKAMAFDMHLPPAVRIVDPERESVRELLAESEIMITDYSSVCWDFIAMGKPVVFYRFDLASYRSARDSYIDLEDQSYGPVVTTRDELLSHLERLMSKSIEAPAEVMTSMGMVSSDGNWSICARIYAIVMQELVVPGTTAT